MTKYLDSWFYSWIESTIYRSLRISSGGESGLQIAEILEGKEVKMAVDFSIPTDRQITERRPDLVLYLKKERRIVMTEVACAWEPLILEREEDKGSKYGELFS